MKTKHDEKSFFSPDAKEKYSYKDYKPLIKKDVIRVTNFLKDQAMLPPDQQSASIDFFLSTKYSFTDKADFPLLIIGSATGTFLKTLKDKVKDDKKINAMGTCKTIEDDKGNTLLELNIEKGAARPKLIKKLLEKWLMPDGVTVSFPGGVLELDEAMGEDENDPDAQKKPENAQPVQPQANKPQAQVQQAPVNPKIVEAFTALDKGDFNDDEAKKRQVKNQIQNFLDNFFSKYETFTEQQKAPLKNSFDEYTKIKNALKMIPDIEVVSKGAAIEPVMTLDDMKLLGGGTSWGFGKTTYDLILDALTNFHKTADAAMRVVVLKRIETLVAQWEKENPVAKQSKDDKKRAAGLKALLDNLKPYTTGKVQLLNVTIDKTKLNTGTSISSEKAGTSKATARAKQIAEATVDERIIELANLLQQGGASDDDKTFGAVMKWLADNGEDVEKKYVEATVQLFNNPSQLKMDLGLVFKTGSLRHTFLIQKYEGKESPYAPVAMALGILGNGWFNTEIGDAFLYMDKNLKSDQLDVLADVKKAEASKDAFAIAASKKLAKDAKFIAEMQGMSLVKGTRDKKDMSAKLQEINTATKRSYVSGDDYFLCAAYDRLDGMTGVDVGKLAEAVKKWVAQTTPDQRAKILDAGSEFSKLIATKVAKTIGGLSKSEGAQIRSIIQYFTEPPKGQEATKVLDQINQLAAEQSQKSSFSKWKQDEEIGEKFKTILFSDQVESPQLTLVQKFCTKEEAASWEKADETTRMGLLAKAKAELNAIMAKANVNAKKAAEILDMVDSDGARGTTYYKIKADILDAKTNIGAADNFMTAIDGLAPDSKEIMGIKDDLEMLRALKKRALDGMFKTDSDRKKWKTAMGKLGLPPTADEIKKAKDASDADKANADLKEKYDILLELQELADPSKLPTDADLATPPTRAGRTGRKKFIPKEEIDAKKAVEEKALKASPKYWAARLAAEYKKGFTGRDDHKLLQIAYETNKAGMKYDDLMRELLAFSEGLHKEITYAKESDWDAGNSAYMIQCTLNGTKVPSINEMLEHAKKDAIFQRRVRLEDLTTLTDNATEEELISQWFDVDSLKTNLNEKKALLAEIDAIKKKPQKTPQDVEALKAADQKMATINGKINQFDIKDSILEKFDDTAKADKVLDFKKQLRNKVADALKDETKAPALLEMLKKAKPDTIDLTLSDLALMSTAIKGISTLEYETSLETGLQWNSLSSRMLQRDMEVAKYLKEGWKGKEKLQQVKAMSEKDRAKEESSYVAAMKTANEDVESAQERFLETKQKYDARLKQIVAIFVGAVFFAITSLSGVGAAGLLIQLAWSVASAAITTMVKQLVEKIAKGDNYDGVEEFFVNFLGDQVTNMVGFWVEKGLDAIDLPGILDALEKEMTGDGVAAKVFTTPLKDILKDMPKDIADTITKSVVNQLLNEKGSVVGKTMDDMGTYLKDLIKGLPLNYLKGVLGEATKLGKDELAKLFGGDENTLNFDDKWGEDKEKGEESYLKALEDPKEFFNNMAENFKNPTVLINIANGMFEGEVDDFEFGLKTIIDDRVDSIVEKVQATYPDVAVDKLDIDGIKEQIARSADEALEKLRKQVTDSYDKLPDDVKAQVKKEDIAKKGPKQLTKLLNKMPGTMPLKEVKAILVKKIKMTDKAWDAWSKWYDLEASNTFSLEEYLNMLHERKVAFENVAFADDIISEQIFKPYQVFENGKMVDYSVPRGLRTMKTYAEWQKVQKLVADGKEEKELWDLL